MTVERIRGYTCFQIMAVKRGMAQISFENNHRRKPRQRNLDMTKHAERVLDTEGKLAAAQIREAITLRGWHHPT
jgi:hypothetical protein